VVLSILAHELSHALVGRAQGVPIAGITLFMFGGMAHTRHEPPSPRAELLMTIVGPITSIVIGVLALAIGARLVPRPLLDSEDPLRAFQSVGPLATILLWLGPINIVIGLFNLVPGFPLDGGRLLRAALWAATGDLRRATRWAARIGQAFGLLLVFAGINMMFGLRIPFFGRGLGAGLWIAFIGWFLNRAAAASYSQLAIQELLRGIPVARLMRRETATVAPTLTIAELVDDFLMATEQRAFPIVDGEMLLGLVTLDDVRRIPRAAWADKSVRDIMTRRDALATTTPREDAAAALEKIIAKDVEQLPVVTDGRFEGMLRRRDILRWLELQSPAGASFREREAT
jgi:Zn-dependent protease